MQDQRKGISKNNRNKSVFLLFNILCHGAQLFEDSRCPSPDIVNFNYNDLWIFFHVLIMLWWLLLTPIVYWNEQISVSLIFIVVILFSSQPCTHLLRFENNETYIMGFIHTVFYCCKNKRYDINQTITISELF